MSADPLSPDIDSSPLPALSISDAVHQLIRLLVAVVGLGVMVLAALYTVRGLNVLLVVYRDPQGVEALVTRWSEMLGGDKLVVVQVGGKEVSWARPVALLALLIGAMVYFAACSSFLVAGARVVQTAVTTRTWR